MVCIPELVQNDIHLKYTDAAAHAIDKWMEEAKGDRWCTIQTVLHE